MLDKGQMISTALTAILQQVGYPQDQIVSIINDLAESSSMDEVVQKCINLWISSSNSNGYKIEAYDHFYKNGVLFKCPNCKFISHKEILK